MNNISTATMEEISNDNFSNQGNYTMLVQMGPRLYQYIYVALINAIIFIVGIIGNSLVIYVFATIRSMRKRMNYFLVSLSVADLLVLLVALPTSLLEFYGKDKWYLGDGMCIIVPFLEHAAHKCSVLTLVAIGFERYYAICHPLRDARFVSTNFLIPFVWVVSCVVSVPFAIYTETEVVTFFDGTEGDMCRSNSESVLFRIYIFFTFVVCHALPLIFLTIMYTAIVITLYRSTLSGEYNASAPRISRASLDSKANRAAISIAQRALHPESNDHVRNSRTVASRRQVVRMMVTVMALYFLCLLPMHVVTMVKVFGPDDAMASLRLEGYLNLMMTCRILINVNSAGNPIIYGLLSANFRAAFKQSLFKCRCRKQNRSSVKYNTSYYSNNHFQYYLHNHGTPSHIANNHINNEMSYSPNDRPNVMCRPPPAANASAAKNRLTPCQTIKSTNGDQRENLLKTKVVLDIDNDNTCV